MLDAMASLLTFNAGMYFASGESPKRRGNVHPTISPYETFEASDGWINIGVANDKFWSLFCGVVGRKDLETDPRFDAAPKRAANRAALAGILHRYSRANRAAAGSRSSAEPAFRAARSGQSAKCAKRRSWSNATWFRP